MSAWKTGNTPFESTSGVTGPKWRVIAPRRSRDGEAGSSPWMGPSSGTSQRSQRSICPSRTRQVGMGGPLARSVTPPRGSISRRGVASLNPGPFRSDRELSVLHFQFPDLVEDLFQFGIRRRLFED